MSVFVLFAIVFLKSEPRADYAVFGTMAACESARAAAIKTSLEHNVTEGSFTCTEHKVGTFS